MICYWLVLIHVNGSESWPTSSQRLRQCSRFNQSGSASVDKQRRGFHLRQISRCDNTASLCNQFDMQAEYIGLPAQRILTVGSCKAIAPSSSNRAFPAPYQHVHPEGAPIACYQAADFPISEN